jgi:hypothetical protein
MVCGTLIASAAVSAQVRQGLMERIEPTIGKIDFQVSAEIGTSSAKQRRRRIRQTLADWLVVALLAAIVFPLLYWVTSRSGLLPGQFQLGTPKLLERVLIVVGFGVVFGSQFIGSIFLFRFSFERGALALLLSGYLPIALKRSGIFWAIMGPWCIGILLVVVGTILLS